MFDNISADMTEEEKALAASTPSTPPPLAEFPNVLPAPQEFVDQANCVAPGSRLVARVLRILLDSDTFSGCATGPVHAH
jgi:hypothetical protein